MEPRSEESQSAVPGLAIPRYIVAVGASAGGLEALEAMFSRMPEDTGAAFVVLQHLSPDFESRMDELLSRQTRIPVERVVENTTVLPNHIYLNPPRKDMIISGGRLVLADREPQRGVNLPIDHFFRALAHDAGQRAVAVVLSGTGSDGSRGVREIHEEGGFVITQSASTAKFDGMPRAAQDTGVVDLVLDPEDIPDALVRHFGREVDDETSRELDEDTEISVNRVMKLLRREQGIDFTQYKPSTVMRRIERRMALRQIDDWKRYVAELQEDPSELDALYRDLLIGVTRFFRDAEAFEFIERDVVPRLIAGAQSDSEIRVWVPGCATGEEAYSLAMIFFEQLEATDRLPNVRIFATDLHRTSLDIASAGSYHPAALEDLSAERRSRFFVQDGALVRVTKDLRQMVVFARHNVLTDAPFTRMDLISCRNMLIYLRPLGQRKVISLFHFALRAGGVLFLGPSESAGDLADEFETLEKRWKVYRKRRDVYLPNDSRMLALTQPSRPQTSAQPWLRSLSESQLLSAYDRLLSRCMPPSFLVDERYELLHTFAGAEKFLSLKGGRPTTHLVELVHEDVRMSLSGALVRAAKEQKTVVYSGVLRTHSDGRENFKVSVEPFKDTRAHQTHYLVQLETTPVHVEGSEASAEVDGQNLSKDYVESLENELQFARENLQATIEELETSNEELQAANEELVASNEELQSTNEELHSVNEELHTVNVEYQRKIVELTELTDDLDNLLMTTELGVLFLDESLAIRKFTPRMAELLHLLPQDIGRKFDGFARNLDHPNLLEDVQRVLRGDRAIEREIEGGGCQFLMRVLPYRGKSRRGALVTLVDVSTLRIAENDLRKLSSVVEQSAEAILVLDLDGRIGAWNQGAETLYGYTAREIVGKSVALLLPGQLHGNVSDWLARVGSGEHVTRFEATHVHRGGASIEIAMTLSPIRDVRNRVVGASLIAHDITQRKRAEDEAQNAVRQRDQFLAMLSHELRNPLAALVTAARLMDDECEGRALREHACKVIQRQSRFMARLLDDLLDVTRMRKDGVEMRKVHIDLRETVPGAVEMVAPLAEACNVNVELELGDEPLPVHVDPARMQQVHSNLLSNAIKYSPKAATVELSLERVDGTAIVRVRDRGIGLGDESRQRIFEPFVQSAKPLDPSLVGMGLGLAIVRSIVEAHGGHVRAESEGLGQGSAFVAEIPIDKKGKTKGTLLPEPKRAVRRIVLVEDQADSRELLAQLLKRRGFEVTTAANGPIGLRLILEERPDVAIVDIGLPGLDGHEIARHVREKLDRDEVRLIALTGWGQQRDREAALEAGFDQHLVKPIDADLLFDVLTYRTRFPN